MKTEIVARRLVFGMERQPLLVGLDAALTGLRPQAVVEALDVIALAAGQPVGAVQRAFGELVALVEEAEIVVDDREFRQSHGEVGVDLDGFLEQRRGFGRKARVRDS